MYQYRVRSLRLIVTLLLAFAWMPLTAHCQIESLTGLEVLRCAPAEACAAPAGSPCDSGLCCSWESGQYHLPQSQPVAAAPLAAVLPQLLALAAEKPPTATVARVLADALPKTPRPWQFSLRAALPVRAPSIAS